MKFFYLVLLSLALPSVFAISIAISPAVIEINSTETINSFILINSNNQNVTFSIKSTSNEIILEETTGTLEANFNKQINFKTLNLNQDSYIVISFESENSISPALTLKLKKTYNESTSQNIMQENQEIEITETNQEIKIQTSTIKENNNLIYILLAVFVLLLIPIFSTQRNKKYRIGQIGQRLRIFIKKLFH